VALAPTNERWRGGAAFCGPDTAPLALGGGGAGGVVRLGSSGACLGVYKEDPNAGTPDKEGSAPPLPPRLAEIRLVSPGLERLFSPQAAMSHPAFRPVAFGMPLFAAMSGKKGFLRGAACRWRPCAEAGGLLATMMGKRVLLLSGALLATLLRQNKLSYEELEALGLDQISGLKECLSNPEKGWYELGGVLIGRKTQPGEEGSRAEGSNLWLVGVLTCAGLEPMADKREVASAWESLVALGVVPLGSDPDTPVKLNLFAALPDPADKAGKKKKNRVKKANVWDEDKEAASGAVSSLYEDKEAASGAVSSLSSPSSLQGALKGEAVPVPKEAVKEAAAEETAEAAAEAEDTGGKIDSGACSLSPGVVLLKAFLTPIQQRAILDQVQGEPFYRRVDPILTPF